MHFTVTKVVVITPAAICPLERKTGKTFKQQPYSPVSMRSSSDEGVDDYKTSLQRSTRTEVTLDLTSTTGLKSPTTTKALDWALNI